MELNLPESTLAALHRWPVPTVLSDASDPECGIVFANSAFQDLTEYPEDMILGRNCRFLQTEDVDKAETRRVRDALQAREPVEAILSNKTRSGAVFQNELHLTQIVGPDLRPLVLGCQFAADAASRRLFENAAATPISVKRSVASPRVQVESTRIMVEGLLRVVAGRPTRGAVHAVG